MLPTIQQKGADAMEPKGDSKHPEPKSSKKRYSTPRLDDYGSLAKLTASGSPPPGPPPASPK